jgi:hypothetical protein
MPGSRRGRLVPTVAFAVSILWIIKFNFPNKEVGDRSNEAISRNYLPIGISKIVKIIVSCSATSLYCIGRRKPAV